MQAQDVMSRDVVTVEPEATILNAARLMLQRKISGLPVATAAGELVGIVTEGDFLRRAETGTVRRRPRWLEFVIGPGRLADEYARATGRIVKEVMTREVRTVTEEAPLKEVVDLMERFHVKRLPVLRGQRIIGIITRQNVLRALVGRMSVSVTAATDDAIRERLLGELKKQPWAPVMIDAVVTDGRLKLVGTIFDDRQRKAIRVAAENIPGVKSIEDQLVWIEPMSGTLIEAAAS